MKKIRLYINWIGYRMYCLSRRIKYPMDWYEYHSCALWAEYERDHADEIERFESSGFIRYEDIKD